MKPMHWGMIVLLLVAYLVGVKFPGAGQTVLSKVGM